MLTTLAVLAAIFVPLERLLPTRRQPVLRPAWRTDLAFFFGQHLLWSGLAILVLASAQRLLSGMVPPLPLPWPAQVALVLLLGDLLLYWFHRACHHFDFLWRFHAVHHSAEHLDWLAAHREHPIDGLLTQLVLNLPALVFGVSMKGLFALALFRGLWALFIHSNVKLPLGPLLYVLGSPRLHHWHHAKDPRVVANFGNLSPWTDLLFGTFHLPRQGEDFALGVPQAMPRSWPALILAPMQGAPLSVALVLASTLTAFTAFAGDGGLDAGVDAGTLSSIFKSDQNYLPASKSFGGGTLGPGIQNALGGLGGPGADGGTVGIGGLGRGLGSPLETKTTTDDPSVLGLLDKSLVQKVVRAHLGLIKQCATQHLAIDGGVNQGRVVVKFVVQATGTVGSSAVVQTTVANEGLESCVAGAVQRMVFPKPRGGGVAVVAYPFVFAAP
ncbi:MAG: sterol desaturase family protein [Myxococcaceae bacterium]